MKNSIIFGRRSYTNANIAIIIIIGMFFLFSPSLIKKNPSIFINNFHEINSSEYQGNGFDFLETFQIPKNSDLDNLSNIQKYDFPVDIVYTWVNGSDPIWSSKKDEAMRNFDLRVPRGAQDGRYIDIGELKYSLRCIEKFLPWFNKIYIVTDNQFPNFLKKNQSKIEIISHSQIIPNKFLPTFNSNNIDFHLHLIPNLTEHFIYLNDDVFISRPLEKKTFFDPYGRPILPVAKFNWRKKKNSMSKVTLKHWNYNDMGTTQYNLIVLHTVDVFINKFNKSYNYKCRHGYIPLTITLMKKMWEYFPYDLHEVEKHTFRSHHDIQLPTLLIQLGIGSKYAITVHKSSSVRYLVMGRSFLENLKEFNSSQYDSFCLNSGERTSDKMRMTSAEFLDKSYPNKSSFEI